VKYSIILATRDRAHHLRGTLASLATIKTADEWEVIVVDNNSVDDTPGVVQEMAHGYPARLRYVCEAVPGRSAALNTGIAWARGRIIATTDDDVRVPQDWLDVASAALDRLRCHFVGGKVLPIWSGPRPAWLPEQGGSHWAVIALLDRGTEPLEFDRRMPLGVNMVFRREAFDIAGGWDQRIGRKAGTLLSQEVREWCLRARAKGLSGFYVPEMAVRHVISAERLRKAYFRRWFYWRGVSRAMLYQQHGLDMQSPDGEPHDFTNVPRVGGVPRDLYGTAARHAAATMISWMRGEARAAFEHQLWLCMFAGIVRQRWHDRQQPFGSHSVPRVTAT
jgi:glycosyltransferase involved in cell wall biosynthesis